MLLHIFLLLIVFAFILVLLGLAWESYPLFAFTTFLFFAIAGLSVMIQIPFSSGNIDVFNDDASRVFFILMGSLSGLLTVLYKFKSVPEEEGPEGHMK